MQRMNYQYILFDMDGTVLETLEDLYDATNVALKHFGLPEITMDDCRRYVGNGAARLIEQAVPAGTPEEKTKEVLEYYVPWYAAHSNIKTAPYPGIMELLQKIREAGGKSAIISNKPDVACKSLSEIFFQGMVETAIGQSDRIARKPAPDTIFEAMKILGAKKEDCVYIGDSEVDIQTAKNAGISCISVLWGFRTREELEKAGASAFAADPDELFRLL